MPGGLWLLGLPGRLVVLPWSPPQPPPSKSPRSLPAPPPPAHHPGHRSAKNPSGEDINALQQHIKNLLTPSTPDFFNTLYDPYREGADFVRGYPFGMREGKLTAVSHGLWLNIPDYDAPTQMVKPMERNTRYVDAVMTIPKVRARVHGGARESVRGGGGGRATARAASRLSCPPILFPSFPPAPPPPTHTHSLRCRRARCSPCAA